MQYQNLFTTVQAVGPVHHGVELGAGQDARIGDKPAIFHLLGRFGNAQIGPIYLGWLGLASLLFGFFAIEIIGLNMAASVNWDPVEFVRQFFWLTLNPPGPEHGFSPFVPLKEGGWWILAGFFLTLSFLLWWARGPKAAS